MQSAADAASLTDLSSSGLTFKDLNARAVTPPELAATNSPVQGVQGYVIPYYDITGKAIPFYRVKLINYEPKYKQPRGTANHVYYPPGFRQCLEALKKRCTNGLQPFVLLTEGEKKAACGTKYGFPTLGLGGVDSWKSKTLTLPGDVKLTAANQGKKKVIMATMQSTKDAASLTENVQLAEGLSDLIDMVVNEGLYVIIVFDSEYNGETKPEVQRAAAQLAYKLRFEGIPLDHIKQIILPPSESGPERKVGLDDFLIEYGQENLQDMVEYAISSRDTFPRHPNPRAFVAHALNHARLNRDELQEVSLAVLTELDARGRRLWASGLEEPYFFDATTNKLMKAVIINKMSEPLHESPFGRYLYREFGLGAADTRILVWLAGQFTGEPPVDEVEPQRILARPKSGTSETEDCIALQISDSDFALVTPDPVNPIRILPNGSEGILFEADQVDPINPQELLTTIHRLAKDPKTFQPWWMDVLGTVSLKGADVYRTKELAACLFYISPWLYRWRGTQLPVEVFHGEPNSGKSNLLSLRLSILTGRPILRNVPTDIKDWYASVANAGGLFVTDNVQFTDRSLRQRLSDELCRIVTAPDPYIEMRRLYTTTGQARVPVHCTFSFTSVSQPFNNPDIIQRAAIFELEALESMNNAWLPQQLAKKGGRVAWVAHQLLILHRFLFRSRQKGVWQPGQEVSHRLAYYEQALTIVADVLNLRPETWLKDTLTSITQKGIEDADWTIEALKTFMEEMGFNRPIKPGSGQQRERFTSADIASWAETHEEFSKNLTISNSRKLGRYMQTHKAIVRKATGITEYGVQGNKHMFVYVEQ